MNQIHTEHFQSQLIKWALPLCSILHFNLGKILKQ